MKSIALAVAALTGCKTTPSAELRSTDAPKPVLSYERCQGLASEDLGIVDGSLKLSVTGEDLAFSWTKVRSNQVENFSGHQASVQGESVEFAGFAFDQCDMRMLIEADLRSAPAKVDMMIMCADDAFHADFSCTKS